MESYFHSLLGWVALHPHQSGAIIFLVAMTESLAIVGLIVPGVAMMFGIGALIAAGSISFLTAMAWAVAGAVAGDSLSFWLGLHYRQRLTNVWPFSRHPDSLQQGISFFEKYGGKSVAFGRFFGPMRAVIPLVAGMMGMSPLRFFLANLLSALAWAPAYLLPGMVFGASLELASEVAFRLVLLLLLLALLLWLITWLVHRLFLIIHPHSSALVQLIYRWGKQHPGGREISAALTDPDHPEARGLSILAILLLLGAALFTLILGWILKSGGTHQGLDYTVLQGLQALRTPWADQLMLLFTSLADSSVMISLFTAVLLLLLWRGHRRAARYWTTAAGFCLIATPLLKYSLHIPRPEVVPGAADSFAFPSGHTLWAMVLYGFLAIMVARGTSLRWRWLPYSLAGLLISAVALSRLYLGMHWLSDVLGSITLGLSWISILGIAYHRHTTAEEHAWRLATTAALAVILASGLQWWLLQEQKAARYSPQQQIREMPATHWWQNGWSELPHSRLDVRDRRRQPLRLQYAGDLDYFRRQMIRQGWQPAPLLSWSNLLQLLSPSLPLQQLPVLPQIHAGRENALVLSKDTTDGERRVIRLWPSAVQLMPGHIPVWVGTLNKQYKRILFELFTFAATSEKEDGRLLQQLEENAPPGLLLRRVDNGERLLLRQQ